MDDHGLRRSKPDAVAIHALRRFRSANAEAIHALRRFRPADAEAIHALPGAAGDIDVRSTLEPPLDPDGIRDRLGSADWAVVAVDPAGSVAGWGALTCWTEGDGTRVLRTDGFVALAARRRGLGTRLLLAAEEAAATYGAAAPLPLLPRPGAAGPLAARPGAGREPVAGPVVLAGNASTTQPDRAALLLRHGYRRTFAMIEMEHHGPPPPQRRLPDGVAVRPATVEDAPALVTLAHRAWAGRPYFVPPTEARLRDWLQRSDLSLFDVATREGATAGDRVVGLVAAVRTPLVAEIDDVQIDPDLQRRGLATAMLTRVLTRLAGRDDRPVRLHTEEHDPAGARTLYERLGFRVVAVHNRYRRTGLRSIA